MQPYLVDVPVRVMLWTRPECLEQQFAVLRQARPSVLFLISDGGRTEAEWEKIRASRAIFEKIDWQCTVHRFFMDENQGMYTMMQKTREFIWSRVDRCIFLEDDYVPAVSFFAYCAELLARYEDDPRIHMICGYNPLGVYAPADAEQDYFFTENGWAIWGCAYWRRSAEGREFPLPYADSPYTARCLQENLSAFWQPKAAGYLRGELVDNHVPGSEFFHAANSVLQHRLSIVPSRNLISNIGADGTHADSSVMLPEIRKLFHSPVYELSFPLRHPRYVIDDKGYARLYEEALLHTKPGFFTRLRRWLYIKSRLLRQGRFLASFRRDKTIEK